MTAVFTVQEAAEHQHMTDRGGIVSLQHDALGSVRTLGAPFQLPQCPGGPTTAAPLLGQHNDELIEELGFDLTQLRSTGAIPDGGAAEA